MEFNKEFLKLYKDRMTMEEKTNEPSLEGFVGGPTHLIPGAGIMAYSPQEKAEDKMLLRSLQRGEMGSGPNIDKAVQDLINRINGVRLPGA